MRQVLSARRLPPVVFTPLELGAARQVGVETSRCSQARHGADALQAERREQDDLARLQRQRLARVGTEHLVDLRLIPDEGGTLLRVDDA